MSRVIVAVDETRPLHPIVSLQIMGNELRMSDAELQTLINDLDWAKAHVSAVRRQYYANLPKEYCRA